MPKPPTSPSGQPRKRITVRLDPVLLPRNTDWGEDFSPLIERLLYDELQRRKEET